MHTSNFCKINLYFFFPPVNFYVKSESEKLTVIQKTSIFVKYIKQLVSKKWRKYGTHDDKQLFILVSMANLLTQ